MNTAIEQSGLNQTQVDRFQTDGFLLVEDFFTQDELDGFGAAVDAAVAHRTSDDHRNLTDKNLYEQTFVQCMRLWEDRPAVSPFTFHPKLCAAAAALLQTECVRLWHDQALYKDPGGRKTDAHLDYPFWPVDRQDLVSVWIPFDDVHLGGGMMSYVRGSHRIGFTKFADIGQLHGGEPYDLLQEPQIAALPLVPVEARRGSAIFHHACTIHAADANETDATRRVFTMAYMADGCRRSRDDAYFSLDRDDIGSGDLIVGPGHPIAWPRNSTELPTPPEVLGARTGFGATDSDKFK
ncbi:MAG: phytanoyl-CoA dioxygenase family protein [Proteobacteria bacterium]|nr:phytanoyl-CoA dioxygenase family protein [Pseudomonadota bacterium]